MIPHLIANPFVALALASAVSLPLDDTCATAETFFLPSGSFNVLPGLEVSEADTVDHYRTTVSPGHEVRIDVIFLHEDGDANYRLWNSDCTTELASSLSMTDDERIVWLNDTAGPVEVVSEIFLEGAGTVPYELRGQMVLVDCVTEDDWEPNDSCAAPYVFPNSGFVFGQNRTLQQGDDDYYEFSVPPFSQYDVILTYNPVNGPIGMELYDTGCTKLGQSFTGASFYQTTLDNLTAVPEVYVLRVFLEDTTTCQSYTLNLRASPGVNFCTSGPNSTGLPATMFAFGSSSVSNNALQILAGPAPFDAFGIFYYGPDEQNTPFGNGVRCVGGSIVRSPLLTAPGGTFTWFIDMPSFDGTTNPITAGSIYNFQCWFRDTPAGGSGFDLSDGMRFQFLP